MLENICLVPCKATDNLLPPSNLVSINEATDNNAGKNISAMSMPVERKQDPAEIVTVVKPTGVESTEKETSCPVNETEMHASSDSSANLLCKIVNNCPQVEGTSGSGKSSEPRGTQVDKVIQDCVSVNDVSLVPCGSTVKQGEIAASFDKLSGDLKMNLLNIFLNY